MSTRQCGTGSDRGGPCTLALGIHGRRWTPCISLRLGFGDTGGRGSGQKPRGFAKTTLGFVVSLSLSRVDGATCFTLHFWTAECICKGFELKVFLQDLECNDTRNTLGPPKGKVNVKVSREAKYKLPFCHSSQDFSFWFLVF